MSLKNDLTFVSKSVIFEMCRQNKMIRKKTLNNIIKFVDKNATYEQLLNLAFNPNRKTKYLSADVLEHNIMNMINNDLQKSTYSSVNEKMNFTSYILNEDEQPSSSVLHRIAKSKGVDVDTLKQAMEVDPDFKKEIMSTYKNYEIQMDNPLSTAKKYYNDKPIVKNIKKSVGKIGKEYLKSPIANFGSKLKDIPEGPTLSSSERNLNTLQKIKNFNKWAKLNGINKEKAIDAYKNGTIKQKSMIDAQLHYMSKNPEINDLNTIKGGSSQLIKNYYDRRSSKIIPAKPESFMQNATNSVKSLPNQFNNTTTGVKAGLGIAAGLSAAALAAYVYKKVVGNKSKNCNGNIACLKRAKLTAHKSAAVAARNAASKARTSSDKREYDRVAQSHIQKS